MPKEHSEHSPLESVLAKLASADKLPSSAVKDYYDGQTLLELTNQLGKALDSYRAGEIDEAKLDTIQRHLSASVAWLRADATGQDAGVAPKITTKLLGRVRRRMSSLMYLSKNTLPELLGKQLPFKDKQALIILHFTRDLIPFLEACEKLGLNPKSSHLFYKPYLYPHGEQVADYLRDRGFVCISPLDEVETVLATMSGSSGNQPIVVIEDGGYVIPLLHTSYPALLQRCIGGVEQTTRGINNDSKMGQPLSVPIMSVAQCQMKVDLEPPHVADAVISNIESLISFERLRGESAAIMGYGYIGKEIAARLKDRVDTVVFDPRPEKRTEARGRGFKIAETPPIAVADKFIVIGCSGETSIGRKEIAKLSQHTYLVSATSDQREIGLLELQGMSAGSISPLCDDSDKVIGTSYLVGPRGIEVCLIADGYPINFWCSESMPDKVSSLILSLLLVSAVELVQEHGNLPPGIHVKPVDTCAEKCKLAEVYEDI